MEFRAAQVAIGALLLNGLCSFGIIIFLELPYLLQVVLSLIQVILLVTQEEGKRFYVEPRLSGVPSFLKSLIVIVYVVGMTLLLHRGFSMVPNKVTAQVTLYGAGLLEVLDRLMRWRQIR